MNPNRLALLAACAWPFLSPETAWAQSCPDANSHTTATLTVDTGDGSVPWGTVPYSLYRDGVLLGSSNVAVGGAEVPLSGGGNGTSVDYSFAVGGGDYFIAPPVGGVTCTQSATGGGGCTVMCSGSAHATIFSNHGSYYGRVKTFPKDRVQTVSYRFVDSGLGQNFNTLADGSFQLASYNPNNNWSQVVLGGGAGPGYRTANFFVSSPAALGTQMPHETSSNENHFVLLFAIAPYFEPPCGGPSGGSGGGSPGGSPGGGPVAAGPTDCVPRPVRLTNGEMFLSHTDASVGDLSFARHYSSNRRTAGRYGLLGTGWNTPLDERLAFPETGVIEARTEDGMPSYFVDSNADGTFESVVPPDPLTWIETIPGGGYKKKYAAGGEAVYTAAGKLSSTTDASGVTTTYTRNGSNQVTSISRLGRSLAFIYSVGRLTQINDGAGTVLAIYIYDGNGRFSGVQYPDNTGYVFGYDGNERLAFVGDQGGRMIERHEYDAKGRATTSEIDEGREKYTLSYGAGTSIYENSSTTVTDALGNSTTYDFKPVAGSLMITKVTGPCSGCGGAGDVFEWEYDDLGNITKRRDAAGKEWLYTYDSNRRMLTETNPLNQTTTYTYDAQGRMLTKTGPDGSVTTYVQSANGPTSITQAVTVSTTRTTNIAYHPTNGRPQTITDPRGKVTTMAYNGTTADLISVTDPLGHGTTFAYDALGRRTTVTDALSHTTTTDYDVRGRVTKVTNHLDANGTGSHTNDPHTDFSYDKSGRRETVKDPLGRVTRYVYDDYGRLVTVLDPLNQATHYKYDLMGNLTSISDAKNQTTSFEYDPHYRVKKTIYPGGAYETFTYDSRGRLATMVDRKNVTTTYAYDDLGRLTGNTFTNDPSNTPGFSYSYDVAGRMHTAQNGSDTLTWTYNLAGDLLSEQSAANSSTVAYTYDDGGNRLSVSLDGQLFVSYAYDDASRLTTITRGTNVFGFGYDSASRRTSMTYPNGVNTVYQYDNLNRLTNLAATHTASGTPITNFGYQYDAAGNRTQKSTLDFTEDYKYDPLYRLTRADRTNPGATPPNQWTWNYDQVGNRTSAQKDSEATTSSYNEKNQLTGSTGGGKMLWRGVLDEPGNVNLTSAAASINGQPARMLSGNVFEAELNLPVGQNMVTIQAHDGAGNVAVKNYSVTVTAGGATYTYDANGNLTQKLEGADAWVYTWNALNQLTAATKNAMAQGIYSYDPLGRRVGKIAGATTTGWTHDRDDVLRQKATISSSTLATQFIFGPEIDEPLAQEDASTGAETFLHADVLGSIVRQTDASGAPTAPIQYDPWGNIQAGTPLLFAFTAREHEAETGLSYYRARYYDPRAGRFISEDPIGLGDGPNTYLYAKGNPARFNDPWGLWSKEQCAAARKVLDLEEKLGTRRAAAHASVTFGDKILEPFNSSHSPDQNIMTESGPVQIDWFADINTFNPFAGAAPVTYTFGKLYWDVSRLATGAPIGTAMPFKDEGERNAVGVAMLAHKFKDIFTDWTLAQECGCSVK